MSVKNPYIPPNYGMVSTAIERRIAGRPPASLKDEEEAEKTAVKAEAGAPANKMDAAPANKAVSVTAKKAKRKGK